jgi:hypothetical protein
MIDVEPSVFQKCADAFRAAYPNGFIAGERVPQPPRFPAVAVVEMDNNVDERAIDNGAIENAVNVMYQVDVYSNLNTGKKAQAKAIIALLDNVLAQHRFVRTFCNPIQNFNDATIYRMTARYRRRITDQDNIRDNA